MERNRASRIAVVRYADSAGVKKGVYKSVKGLVKVAVNAIVSWHAVVPVSFLSCTGCTMALRSRRSLDITTKPASDGLGGPSYKFHIE